VAVIDTATLVIAMNILCLVLASSITLGQPQIHTVAKYKNLAVYPIYEPIGKINDSNYITLDEGLKSGLVAVSEKGESTPISRPIPSTRPNPNQQVQRLQQGGGAEVNTLWLTNKSGKRLILISGEMVKGGQQDRIIGKDAIIPSSKDPVDIGVYCVEHGRWSGPTDFKESAVSYGLALPAMRGATQSAGKGGGAVAQQQVWDKVERAKVSTNVVARTNAYADIASDKNVAKELSEYVKAIDSKFDSSRAVGVAIAINGEMVWVDRFSSNTTFRKYWPKLLSSYAMGALTNRERKPSTAPSLAEALNFTNARDGKISYDVSEFKAKVTKIDGKTSTIFRLEDLAVNPAAAVHESKVVKV
jgi:hypothetical protein